MNDRNAETLLEARDVTISLGGEPKVAGVSLSVHAGECVALVGESGSGKTLTCRALLGSLHRIGGSMEGSVRLRGREVAQASPAEWRRLRGSVLGFVPQASMAGLDPVMRVGDQLVETVRRHDSGVSARGRALELLQQVEMPSPETVLRSYPHQLSGGMRQRVMIALSLAGRPRLLIADEPTTALDVTVERAILELLLRLCRDERMGLLLISHDLGVVRRVADRVSVMRAGEQVEQGITAEVLSRPRHPYTAALLAADPALVEPGQRLAGVQQGIQQEGAQA